MGKLGAWGLFYRTGFRKSSQRTLEELSEVEVLGNHPVRKTADRMGEEMEKNHQRDSGVW